MPITKPAPINIINGLLTQLKNSSYLSYVLDQNIMLGERTNIDVFPAVCIWPESIGSEARQMNSTEDSVLTVNVFAYVMSASGIDLQLVGDATDQRGIMDIENDIKKALFADVTIGGYAIDADAPSSQFMKDEKGASVCAMKLRIQYRQNVFTRG